MLVVDGGSAERGCSDSLQPSMVGVSLGHFGRCGNRPCMCVLQGLV